jgi:hypothetical protein
MARQLGYRMNEYTKCYLMHEVEFPMHHKNMDTRHNRSIDLKHHAYWKEVYTTT